MASNADKGRKDSKRDIQPSLPRNAVAVSPPERDRYAEVDEATLRRCIAGDKEAAGRVVKMYEERIRAYLQTRISPRPSSADVQDLAQEVFLKAFRHIRSFVPQSEGGTAKLGSWLCEIAKNLAIDWHRQRKRRVKTVELDANDGAAFSVPTAPEQEAARQQSEVARIADGLCDEHREILLLREVQGKSYKEIAQICGIPENTVKSRLFRAREDIRSYRKGSSDEEQGQSNEG